MYARLWWKDARQFWPIWVFLALAAVVVQGLLLHYLEQDARNGALGISALICTSLYAFATGAAAFAGEREMGTLRLLDVLPIDRRVVWVGKVSFALATTLALALVLLATAAMSTEQWKPEGSLSIAEALSFGMIVLVALGWGLFWSAILSNALTAAVVAICCAGVSLSLLISRADNPLIYRVGLPIFALCQLLLFLATLLASVMIFARAMRWKRFQLEFRSPVVVNLADSTGPGRAQLQTQTAVATVLASMASPGTAAPGLPTTDRAPHRSWVVEARAVAWQTIAAGRKTWCLLAGIGLVLPALIGPTYLDAGYFAPEWLLLISTGISLVAGVSAFGLENRDRTQRFLTHHGARPGQVWLVKLAVWGVGSAAILGPLSIMARITMRQRGIATAIESFLAPVLVRQFFFGIALVCGMAIRRGITAVVIAMVLGIILMIPLGTLIGVVMLPMQGLLAIPAGLLVVSWAWSGDWLLDRPGPGRWVRLGLLLTGLFALLVGWYAGYRAWSIPDMGPIAPPAAWSETGSASLPTDQNAADLYREAGRRLVGPVEVENLFLERNQGILDLIRRATVRPYCRFLQPEKLTVLDRPDVPPMSQIASLLALDATDRRNHGDLAGAWEDVTALFHMAHQVGEGAGFIADLVWVEQNALGQALEWAVARGQTPERLRAALAAYRNLPKIPPAADMIRAEANLVENTLQLPTSRLRDWAFESTNGNARPQQVFDAVMFDLATMPWEWVRARRLNRLISHTALEDAVREPWQRSRVPDPEIDHAQKTSRHAMMLIRNPSWWITAADHNEVARRVLVQVLALRAWQLKHHGQFPQTLDTLVPGELPSLPNDPYSGQPFGYTPSNNQEVPPLRYALMPTQEKGHAPTPGSWLIYSIGLDLHDDSGITFKDKDYSRQAKDIVFEIPPLSSDAGAKKEKDRGQDAATGQPASTGRPPSLSPGP